MEIVGSGSRGALRHALASLFALAGLALFAAPSQASSGTFERAWGKNVNGGNVFGICTTASACLAGSPGALAGEMDDPLGVAVDASGNVYVADGDNARIQKFDLSGQLSRVWGLDVVSTGPNNNGNTNPEICVPAAGDICKAGVAVASGPGGTFNQPDGIDVSPTGDVFVTDAQTHRLQKFTANGNFQLASGLDVIASGPNQSGVTFEICTTSDVCKGGVAGGSNGELSGPSGVGVGPDGTVYVSEAFNDRVSAFNGASGNFERMWGLDVVSSGPGETIDDGFEICVSFTSICKAGVNGTVGGAFDQPTDVEATATSIYVLDIGNDRVQRHAPAGTFELVWGKDVLSNGGGSTGPEICDAAAAASCKKALEGPAGGEFSNPNGVDSDGSGDVYIADTAAHRLQRFGSGGTFEAAWGKNVNGGNVFGVCTLSASCQFGSAGGLGGEFSFPFGVGSTAGGVVLVSGRDHRIQVLAADPPPATGGETPASSPAASPVPTGQRAAALKKCKKKRRKLDWSNKRFKACKRKANRLPV